MDESRTGIHTCFSFLMRRILVVHTMMQSSFIHKDILRSIVSTQMSKRCLWHVAPTTGGINTTITFATTTTTSQMTARSNGSTIAAYPVKLHVPYMSSFRTAPELHQSPQQHHQQWRAVRCNSTTTTSGTTITTTGLKESYEYIQVDATTYPGVGIITLHRPKALNALCDELFTDLIHAATAIDKGNDSIGCMVLTGSTKAFAAGADISEMKDRTFDYAYTKNMFNEWANITKVSKPIIAAVNGFCLGGGCELAMMCDMIIASDRAKFGQPEINLGVIPGAGGTQRLARAIGKSKAMYMCLTGDIIDAEWAERAGLVAKVVPSDDLLNEAIQIATKIASKGRMSVMMAKEAVNASQELSLQEGLRLERRLFHSLFATADQKEGMSAFLEKRTPKFTHK